MIVPYFTCPVEIESPRTGIPVHSVAAVEHYQIQSQLSQEEPI